MKEHGTASSRTLPIWLAPHTHSKVDIVLVQGLPADVHQLKAIRRAKKTAVVHLVEIGITRDTRYQDTLKDKGAQHDRTEQVIHGAGWTTKRHTLVFGRTGTVYINTNSTLKHIGIDTGTADKLIKHIQTHLSNRLLATYKTRRHLEYTKAASLPQTGGARG